MPVLIGSKHLTFWKSPLVNEALTELALSNTPLKYGLVTQSFLPLSVVPQDPLHWTL